VLKTVSDSPLLLEPPLYRIPHDDGSSSDPTSKSVICPCPILLYNTDVGPGPSDRSCREFAVQVQIVILTIELFGSVFLEEVPHKNFGPFRRDQSIILNVSIQ
jgi:hypothetical protein